MDYSTVYPQYHSGDEDHHAAYPTMYPPQMQPYPISNGPTPILQPEDMQALHARRLNSLSLHQHHQYHPDQAIAPLAAPFPTNSPPPPLSPFDPISPPISGSELSADAAYHSSGTGSPSSSRGTSLVHRHPMSIRYNPTGSPSGSDHSHSRARGRRGRQLASHSPGGDGSDGDEPINIAESMAASRKETTRRQRIEAEQRRRDDLRDGYARLKDALPSSTVKSSKVSLLDRATQHIQQLDQTTQALRARVMTLENEIQRLRAINETLLLSVSQNPTSGEGGHGHDQGDRATSVTGATPIPAPSPSTPHPDPSF